VDNRQEDDIKMDITEIEWLWTRLLCEILVY
jgi:hypothetical protein